MTQALRRDSPPAMSQALGRKDNSGLLTTLPPPVYLLKKSPPSQGKPSCIGTKPVGRLELSPDLLVVKGIFSSIKFSVTHD